MLKGVEVPFFEAVSGARIPSSDAEAAVAAAQRAAGGRDPTRLAELVREIPLPSSFEGLQIVPIEFDESNEEHAAFITAASYMRNVNFQLGVSRSRKRGRAGHN